MALKPLRKQLDFLDWEFGVFFHFGIRTFYEGHRDWDGRESEMTADGFDPKHLDCDQWIKAIKAAGAKYAILTAKHHDGFANWPTAYSSYSVKSAPFMNGKGDVVKAFTDACRANGIKTGLYYSPAQFDQKFKEGKEYDDYFVGQITELLSNYGKIDYLWFDGSGSAGHTYDSGRIIRVIRSLQPEILIFGMWDPDTTWVGNELGVAPTDRPYEWEGRFQPYECDCRIRRENWFYSDLDEESLRPVDDLVGLYYYSIGRGGNLLLNIAPDRRGLLPEKDCKRLLEYKAEIDRRFAHPIPYTLSREGDTFTVKFESPAYVNHVVLSEDLTNGQKIRAFRVLLPNRPELCVHEGGFVGHKRIAVIPTYLTDTLLIKVTSAEEDFAFADMRFYYVQ